MKVANIGESKTLEVLIEHQLDDAIYHLYKNDVAIVPEVVIEDITEADFSGYSSADGDLEAIGNVWDEPSLNADGRFETTGDVDAEFEHNGGATDNQIYGWYLTDATGNLLAIEAFLDEDGNPDPFDMNAEGATIRITPYYSVQSREEVPTGPKFVSVTVQANGTDITAVFDRTVTNTNVGGGQFLLLADFALKPMDYNSGDGSNTVLFTTSGGAIETGDVVFAVYSPGSVIDASSVPMQGVSFAAENLSEV